MTPLAATSASELLTRSTSLPVGASSMMVVWKLDEVNTGTLSFMSLTKTVTVPVPLSDGEPEVKNKQTNKQTFSLSHVASLLTTGQISLVPLTLPLTSSCP